MGDVGLLQSYNELRIVYVSDIISVERISTKRDDHKENVRMQYEL